MKHTCIFLDFFYKYSVTVVVSPQDNNVMHEITMTISRKRDSDKKFNSLDFCERWISSGRWIRQLPCTQEIICNDWLAQASLREYWTFNFLISLEGPPSPHGHPEAHNAEYSGIVSRGESGFIPIRAAIVKSLHNTRKNYISRFSMTLFNNLRFLHFTCFTLKTNS